MLTEADNEIKNMKVRYATGKIDEDIYEVAIREMQNRKDVLTLELEKCNDNLSNLEAQIPVVISTACKLGTLWHYGNLETKRKIQNLVYPNGIYWDKTKRCYRTQNRNKFFDILDRYSISYGKEKGHLHRKMSPCAVGETRTRTGLRPLPPQSSVSTISPPPLEFGIAKIRTIFKSPNFFRFFTTFRCKYCGIL